MNTILEVSHLTKQFCDFTAVDDISFGVKEGEIVGLLGPNGAGKTTTIQMLLGLTTPDNGQIRYFDKDFFQHKQEILGRINFASTYAHIQSRMTVKENFRIYVGLYGENFSEEKLQELLQMFEIPEVENTLYWRLSSGQQTRVILAKALLNKPRLILMDEPTASLDPDIAAKVRKLILALQKNEQVTILLTSHDMAEVEELCDRVIFLNHGKIVAEDTPLGLTKRIKETTLTVTFDGSQDRVNVYLKHEKQPFNFYRSHKVTIRLEEADIPKILFGFKKEGIWVTDIDIQKPDLEDVFLAITKGKYEYTTS